MNALISPAALGETQRAAGRDRSSCGKIRTYVWAIVYAVAARARQDYYVWYSYGEAVHV